MRGSFFSWLTNNVSAMIMASILAMVVWISASISQDPNQEQWLRRIPLEVVGKDADLLVMSSLPTQVSVKLTSPASRWTIITSDSKAVRAWVDLTGLDAGEHLVEVEVEPKAEISPVRVLEVDPEVIEVFLEPLVVKPISVTLAVEGEPSLGYQADPVVFSPRVVTISGPASVVEKVQKVRAYLDIAGSRQTIQTSLALQPLDHNGDPVVGVTTEPESIEIEQPITLQGGFRNVIVKVNVVGNVANGYKLTNISVSPPSVTVFSSNPSLVNALPGYIEAESLDLTGVTDDVETYLSLVLPDGIEIVNDQKVFVQVSVAAIESTVSISLPVEVIGLDPLLKADVAPTTVEVILSGPVPVLETLRPSSLRAVIDVSDLEPGSYDLEPIISSLPSRVEIQSILPATVRITIRIAPTPTPTPTLTLTPTPTADGTPRPSP